MRNSPGQLQVGAAIWLQECKRHQMKPSIVLSGKKEAREAKLTRGSVHWC